MTSPLRRATLARALDDKRNGRWGRQRPKGIPYTRYGREILRQPERAACQIFDQKVVGLRVDTRARVLDTEDRPIPGLYAAGELVGGLFYHNYPGGSGLMAGSVFGRLAGESAAADLG